MTAVDSTVGPWLTGARLGAGRTARVYAARHSWTGEEAAIKLYRGARTRSLHDGTRFLREGRILGALDHPFVPRLIESGTGSRWTLFVAMGRCRGRDLRTLLLETTRRGGGHTRRVQRALLLPAFVRTCSAVQHAHERGFVHGDIKPANIVLDGRGEGGLVDWGMASELGRPGSTRSGQAEVRGTPGYIAPERIHDPGRASSFLEDIYGLGALLYELLTLRPANPGETPEARLRAAFRPRVGHLGMSEAPALAPLASLALRAMGHSPADRPSSARALGEAAAALLG